MPGGLRGRHGDMCSYYSIFAPKMLSFQGGKVEYCTFLRKVTLFSAQSAGFVVY